MESITADVVLDATGLCCPMPVIRTRQAMDRLQPGQVLEVRATDEGARQDIPLWAAEVGHEVLQVSQEGEVCLLYIRKGGVS